MRLMGLVALLFPLVATADITIFDVRKNLPMSDSDPVYRDYILNAGNEAGLSVGMLLTVQRRIPLYDSYQNRSAGDLQLKVARIKIIHVQAGLAVARLQSEFTREGTPLLEDNFIMVGDKVDLSSAGTDKKSEAGSAHEPQAAASPASAPPPQPVASAKAADAQITINTVDLSSATAKAPQPLPQKVDLPVLQ